MSGDNEDEILYAEVNEMMAGVERRERTKQDLLAKMLALANMEKEIDHTGYFVCTRPTSVTFSVNFHVINVILPAMGCGISSAY